MAVWNHVCDWKCFVSKLAFHFSLITGIKTSYKRFKYFNSIFKATLIKTIKPKYLYYSFVSKKKNTTSSIKTAFKTDLVKQGKQLVLALRQF